MHYSVHNIHGIKLDEYPYEQGQWAIEHAVCYADNRNIETYVLFHGSDKASPYNVAMHYSYNPKNGKEVFYS